MTKIYTFLLISQKNILNTMLLNKYLRKNVWYKIFCKATLHFIKHKTLKISVRKIFDFLFYMIKHHWTKKNYKYQLLFLIVFPLKSSIYVIKEENYQEIFFHHFIICRNQQIILSIWVIFTPCPVHWLFFKVIESFRKWIIVGKNILFFSLHWVSKNCVVISS